MKSLKESRELPSIHSLSKLEADVLNCGPEAIGYKLIWLLLLRATRRAATLLFVPPGSLYYVCHKKSRFLLNLRLCLDDFRSDFGAQSVLSTLPWRQPDFWWPSIAESSYSNSDFGMSSTKESDLERQHQNSSDEIGVSCFCADGVNCRLQVAGCRLQVAGQDFTYMWKELDSFFVLLFHTYATVQKQKTLLLLRLASLKSCFL